MHPAAIPSLPALLPRGILPLSLLPYFFPWPWLSIVKVLGWSLACVHNAFSFSRLHSAVKVLHVCVLADEVPWSIFYCLLFPEKAVEEESWEKERYSCVPLRFFVFVFLLWRCATA